MSFYRVRWCCWAWLTIAQSPPLPAAACQRCCSPSPAWHLIVTAFAKTPIRGHGSRLEGYVHHVAAAITFLSVTSAMLLQSWRLRRDAAWRHHFVAAFS